MQYIKNIQHRLSADLKKGLTLCPPAADIFNAYKLTPFESIKVLIIGQDPYFTPGMANGMAFSANRMTPSLDIMFREIKGSTGRVRTKPDLTDWAKQGVFLLNTILTTTKGVALAHREIGWENLTRYTIQRISERKQPLVVMLWGRNAMEYAKYIDGARHLILKAPHPASDSYAMNRGQMLLGNSFTGCMHFSRCNDYMQTKGISQINWGDPLK